MSCTSRPKIHASSLNFLEKLNNNKNRDWFNLHKPDFLAEQKYMENLASSEKKAYTGSIVTRVFRVTKAPLTPIEAESTGNVLGIAGNFALNCSTTSHIEAFSSCNGLCATFLSSVRLCTRPILAVLLLLTQEIPVEVLLRFVLKFH